MTITALQPGCFGSALFFNVNAPECVSCPNAGECAPLVQTNQGVALGMVERLDQKFASERAPAVKRWFVRSHLPDVTRQRSSKRASALLTAWSDSGVNVYHLKHGTNPVEQSGSFLQELFAFMIEAKTFKSIDAVEHLRTMRDETKAALTRQVKEVCDALLHAGVLRKEKHVLCL